jgi:hypothetical protein
VRRICRPFFWILALSLVCVSFASAQSTIDFNFGVGSNHAKSNNQKIDTFGDGTLYNAPSLSGVFLGFGANMMLWKKTGIGAEYVLQPNKPEYAGLQARTSFFDFNGIYQPIVSSKAALQLVGGIGGANMRFYYNSQYCQVFTGCSSSSQYLDSSNHFTLHAGAAVQVYLTDRIFIRPQLDVRYVHNFFQFGSNWVPGGTVWIGYSMGDR